MFYRMEITTKDLGKIVDLSLKPDWGPGIISKMDMRFAYIIFDKAEDTSAKKYFLTENPLKLSSNQDVPSLTKRARAKNRKIKIKKVTVPAPENPEKLAVDAGEPAAVKPAGAKKRKTKETAVPAAAID
jgi:hypothetical protein